jgi:hypothetical protein
MYLRRSDSAFRIGGDEFAIVMPGTDADRAHVAVRRRCRLLVDAGFPCSPRDGAIRDCAPTGSYLALPPGPALWWGQAMAGHVTSSTASDARSRNDQQNCRWSRRSRRPGRCGRSSSRSMTRDRCPRLRGLCRRRGRLHRPRSHAPRLDRRTAELDIRLDGHGDGLPAPPAAGHQPAPRTMERDDFSVHALSGSSPRTRRAASSSAHGTRGVMIIGHCARRSTCRVAGIRLAAARRGAGMPGCAS